MIEGVWYDKEKPVSDGVLEDVDPSDERGEFASVHIHCDPARPDYALANRERCGIAGRFWENNEDQGAAT
jgi:hypothetical protein